LLTLSALLNAIALSVSKEILMNLEEFKAHVLATRQASTMQAMSALSATLTPSTNESETK
jgi:hypothetical protein